MRPQFGSGHMRSPEVTGIRESVRKRHTIPTPLIRQQMRPQFGSGHLVVDNTSFFGAMTTVKPENLGNLIRAGPGA